MPYFLQDNPDANCAKAGHAAYGNALSYIESETKTKIVASHFMTYHTVLKTSQNYYESMRSARRISKFLLVLDVILIGIFEFTLKN